MRQMERDGVDTSELCEYGSELLVGLSVYYEAFWQLHTTRQVGMGVGPIPHTDIVWYCQLRGYDPETSMTLEHHVRAMDDAYLEFQRKELKKKHG